MKSRKNESADLEKLKNLFLAGGLVLTLLIVLGALQYRSYDRSLMDLGQLDLAIDDEDVPITQRELQPPPPPPPAPPEQLQVVEDDLEIEEFEMDATDTDESEFVEFIEDVPQETDEVFNFAVVENKPVFPGCENEPNEEAKFQCFQRKMMEFISKEFKFPEMARTMGIQGRVFVNFVIEKNGSISNVEVVRGVDKLIDEEAVRVVKKLPKFEPAKQRGRPVRMQYTVPINARLQ